MQPMHMQYGFMHMKNYWEADKMTDKDFKDLQKIIDKMLEKEMKMKKEFRERKKDD